MAFFTWGLLAFEASLGCNTAIAHWLNMGQSRLSVTWAPIIEEFFKALPLLYFLFSKKYTAYPLIYFALASGIGFSIQENYMYLLESTGTHGSPVIFIIIRSITTCLMHGVSTALMGYGLQIVRKLKTMVFPLLFGLFTFSITFHALFNLYVTSSAKLLGMMLPILVYMLGLLALETEKNEAA